MSNDQFMKQVFIEGRTHRYFKDSPVDESLLQRLYELAKIAPSSSNLCPMRISFVISKQQKQKVIVVEAFVHLDFVYPYRHPNPYPPYPVYHLDQTQT